MIGFLKLALFGSQHAHKQRVVPKPSVDLPESTAVTDAERMDYALLIIKRCLPSLVEAAGAMRATSGIPQKAVTGFISTAMDYLSDAADILEMTLQKQRYGEDNNVDQSPFYKGWEDH
jgi:hypothetical protein